LKVTSVSPPVTYSVSLKVFGRSEEGGFFACHDTSGRTPTISIYMDEVSTLPLNVVLGGVRRQVAHSIIHGIPEFYIIKLPPELRRGMDGHGFPKICSQDYLRNLNGCEGIYG